MPKWIFQKTSGDQQGEWSTQLLKFFGFTYIVFGKLEEDSNDTKFILNESKKAL